MPQTMGACGCDGFGLLLISSFRAMLKIWAGQGCLKRLRDMSTASCGLYGVKLNRSNNELYPEFRKDLEKGCILHVRLHFGSLFSSGGQTIDCPMRHCRYTRDMDRETGPMRNELYVPQVKSSDSCCCLSIRTTPHRNHFTCIQRTAAPRRQSSHSEDRNMGGWC